MFSFADSMGTANINPLGNAALAYAGRVQDPEEIYKNPDPAMLDRVRSGLPQAVADLHAKLKPLLMQYGADKIDPIKDPYKADHTGLDGLFDHVKFTLDNGTLTITNAKTGAVIFTCAVMDVMGGQFTNDPNAMPNPGSPPAAPTGVTATWGDHQITISWTGVANATSYNIYWSTTPGLTPNTGTKATGATSPCVQAGLAPGITYYYIVTAVNSAGEGPASVEASATTNATPASGPTVPAAPTGVSAAGGTNQVTISWSAVTSATSYNIYWSTTSGVTPTNGTRISGVTSPAIQTGLTAGTTYYYIVTAVNSAGEGAASIQVAATTLSTTPGLTVPGSPMDVTAAGGVNQVTVSWSPVTGATSYNLYWSTTSGVTISTGTRIAGVMSPYDHTGLSASTPYYYVVTAGNSLGESASSAQATATTNPAVFDALAFYNSDCASCHGAPSSFTGGRTAAQLQSAIDSNRGGMGNLSTLTPAQVAAIAALLGP
jgi:fibronectin type 3 domain-containing protein